MPMLGRTRGRYRTLFVAAILLAGCGRVEEPPAATPEAPRAAPNGQVAGGRGGAPGAPTPPRRSAWVIFGADTVVAEVARTQDEQQRGLMYRTELADGTGMIFLWDGEEIRSLWMSNTYVDLDVAFMDAGLRVVDVLQMEAETTEIHSSRAPAMFALEVPRGWLAEHGVAEGSVAELVLGPL